MVSLLFLMGAQSVRAQEITGAISGTMTDPSGAAVPNASVTATDVLTGVAWPTKTNSAGVYGFPRLPIGRYSLRVGGQRFQNPRAPGF